MGLWTWTIAGGILFFLILLSNKEDEDEQVVRITTNYGKNEYDDQEPEIDYYWDEDYGLVPIKVKFRLTYQDAKKQITKRTINISEYDGSAYINAYCELRKDYRTFRIDRIQEAVVEETGEVVDDLPGYLLNLYKQSPEYIISLIIDTYYDIFRVLLYIGKADGQLRRPEREIICATVRSIAKNKTLKYDDINNFINKLEIPTMHGFKLAFGRICKTYPNQTPRIYAIAKKIVDTQKTVHPHEKEALSYMMRKMQKENIVQPETTE